MKLSSAIRAIVLTGVVASVGCNQERPVSPSAPSLFIPNLAGVWSGPMTLQSTSGGECAGQVVGTFLPANDRGTISITQTDADTAATLTMESSGLACRYTGTSSLTSLAMNAVSCDRTGLIVSCLNGQNRELRLVGSSITGTCRASSDGRAVGEGIAVSGKRGPPVFERNTPIPLTAMKG